eukprot:TRINITY_DN4657_c0_g1_i2.p1 TRINITY_DN4657_c0_g1~~TRINITY_DN4657_c0_g1_i2.p1  ORF type:complete len:865 (-),score=221.17 TRINITY_DN4657_c0_g1_i2:71-2665(-)
MDGTVQQITIQDSSFLKCKSGSGGALYIDTGFSNLRIVRSRFEEGKADTRGGSLFISALRNLSIDSTVFVRNNASVSGGCVYATGIMDNIMIRGTTGSYNSALQGGCFDFSSLNSKAVSITSCTFDQNRAEGLYGGVLNGKGTFPLYIIDSEFDSNQGSQGGALYLNMNGNNTLRIHSTRFTNNVASGFFGGGVYLEGQYSQILWNSTVWIRNSADTSGNGEGGAAYLLLTTESFEIDESIFEGNSAQKGGAVSLQSKSEVRNLNINHSKLQGNKASSGASFYISSVVQHLVVSDSLVFNNTATGNGGFTLIGSDEFTIQIERTTFESNRALSGGGLYYEGEIGSQFNVSGSTFNKNEAYNGNGGGLALLVINSHKKRQQTENGTFSVSFSSSNFAENVATQGSSLFLDGGSLLWDTNNLPSRSLFLSDSSNIIFPSDPTDLSFISCNGGKEPFLKDDNSAVCNNITLSTVSTNALANNFVVVQSIGTPAIIGIAVGGGLFLMLIIVAFIILSIRLKRQRILRQRNNFSMIDFSKINLGEAKNTIIDFDELTGLKEIGSGAFGVVFKCNWRSMQCAVKQIKSEDVTVEQITEFLREVTIIKGIRSHPNVVLFLGITFPPQPLSLVTEFCEMGGLYEYLRKHPVTSDQKMGFLLSIARGMLHLHLENIIHRDLAVRNILLSKHLEPKVSDFGLSRESQSVESGSTTTATVGPLKWMSPEAIMQRQYSSKSDVWSYGVLIWEVWEISDPFPDMTAVEAAVAVSSHGQRLPISPGTPTKLEDLMNACWQHKPADRPNFAQICNYLEPKDGPTEPLESVSFPPGSYASITLPIKGEEKGPSQYSDLQVVVPQQYNNAQSDTQQQYNHL